MEEAAKGREQQSMPRQGRQCRVCQQANMCLPYRIGSASLVLASPVRKVDRPIVIRASSRPGQWPRGTKAIFFTHIQSSMHSTAKSVLREKKRYGRGIREGERRQHHTSIAIRTRNDTWRSDRESRGCPRDKSASITRVLSVCMMVCDIYARRAQEERCGTWKIDARLFVHEY